MGVATGGWGCPLGGRGGPVLEELGLALRRFGAEGCQSIQAELVPGLHECLQTRKARQGGDGGGGGRWTGGSGCQSCCLSNLAGNVA